MTIDIRQLRYFTALAETLHFGRAAQRLHVTQPPLSRQIAALEQDLGVRLVERHSRRARLTPAGERFLADARGVLAGLDQACRNARAVDAGAMGELAVGFMMHAAYGVMPGLARRYMAQWPDVRLTLREMVPSALVEGVASGALDAGITFETAPVRGMNTHVIHREALCLVAPAGHRLATLPDIGAEDLAGQPFIASPAEATPTLRESIEAYLLRAGTPPAIRLEAQLQQTIVSLVAEGIGVAIVPESLQKLGIAGVAFRPLAHAPMVAHVVAWRGDCGNPALPHFLSAAGVPQAGA
ncbi:MAG TPA: LysR substrate-binding domain-containing protein [Novosphingobium sp.]|nr:LysR substrate-binding domain-containing protein [Novosphingobium sp.]